MLEHQIIKDYGSEIDVAPTATVENSEIIVGTTAKFTVKPGAILRNCKFHISSWAHVEIGANTRLEGVKLRSRTGKSKFKVGDYCIINQDCLIFNDRSIEIGNYVLIARNSLITDSTVHSLNWMKRREEIEAIYHNRGVDLGVRTANIKIGDDCWLNHSSQILIPKEGSEELVLGKGTVVAASAVVKESFPGRYMLIGGVPAQILKYLD